MSAFKFSISVVFAALAAMFATALPLSAAQSASYDHPAFAKVLGRTSIPVGHAEFCRAHAGECGPNAGAVEMAGLSEHSWQQLVEVNAVVNTAIVPVTDEDLYRLTEYWTYPAGYGDCEDFVLAKRRELINLGWNPSVLLITVVRQRNGEGHAVLMVRTDRGDLVLDNQDGMIRVWNETPYQFIKRQSQADSAEWVDLLDERSSLVAARR